VLPSSGGSFTHLIQKRRS